LRIVPDVFAIIIASQRDLLPEDYLFKGEEET
jgi:hypothetical protein